MGWCSSVDQAAFGGSLAAMTLELGRALGVLEEIAPLRHAAEWDNVGLLVEPHAEATVTRVLLTIDLTEPVLAEALEHGVELVVSYHPPIFSGLKRLTQHSVGERVVLQAIAAGISVFSPHTALDAAPEGVNDWLAEALGPGDVEPLEPVPDAEGVGMGRGVVLHEPRELGALVGRIKQHLGLSRVRVAGTLRHDGGELVERVAVCAGAGGSLLAPLEGYDLYLTGEMRHHDVAAKVARGESVILCDHTNTERGYLPRLADRLEELTGGELEIFVSKRDHDPLEVV